MAKITIEEIKEQMAGGFHCSQVVFGYGAKKAGMDVDLALKLSAGLGGGCRHGDSCGAVIGGIAALGLVYGFSRPGSTEQNKIMTEKVKEFEKRFTEANKYLVCRDLLGGFDFANPAGSAQRYNLAESLKNCPGYCKTACDILDDMM